MDVLIVEPLDPAVLQWLAARHTVHVAPELAQQPLDFRDALRHARSVIIPPSVAIDAAALARSPSLRIVGRLSAGSENIDLDACARAGVEVVRPATAGAAAEAEFVVGALLQLLRRVPVVGDDGLPVGREIGGSTVGIVGVTATAQPLQGLLAAFGARTIGYDPGVHASDGFWARAGVEAVGLAELLRASDAVCVLLGYYPRYAGLFGERLLAGCRTDQVWVSLSHSALFDERALAQALREGPLAAAWLDSLEPSALDPGRPLRHIDTLQITPRVGATTRQSRVRGAWAVAQRVDELLMAARYGDVSPPPVFAAGYAGGPATA